MENFKREEEMNTLVKNYGKTSDEDIRKYLEKITPVLKDKNGNLYRLDKETTEKIVENPRGYSFTYKNELGSIIQEKLEPFIRIDVLIRSASPWTFQPDIGEVFDQMTEYELSQAKAFWLDIRLDEETTSSSGVYECTLYK